MRNTADQPASYNYVDRMSTDNLRGTVVGFAIMGAIWSLVSLFRETSTDKAQHQKRLATFALVLGSLYAGILAILLFGIVAAVTKRLILVRIFSFLAVVATVIAIASGFLRTILHFMLKDGLIAECTALATGHQKVYIWGVWTSNPGDRLTPDEANLYCKRAWSHDSFSEIFWLIVEISARAYPSILTLRHLTKCRSSPAPVHSCRLFLRTA
ncbi:hypothetical protein BJV78DRAFT_1199146 [Lactifluus subvellereus]|nr:hypothetical protein BJV78DRAFT_1199146 [Lactifluus subvellereus]